jgi:hypothetical protein
MGINGLDARWQTCEHAFQMPRDLGAGRPIAIAQLARDVLLGLGHAALRGCGGSMPPRGTAFERCGGCGHGDGGEGIIGDRNAADPARAIVIGYFAGAESNGSGFNDYFEGFTFGSTIIFEVSLYGHALSSPNGTSTSGSTFAFSMFSNAVGTIPTLTTDTTDGFAFTLEVNLDGTTTLTNYSLQTSVLPVGAVPEPSSLILIAGAMFLGGVALPTARRCRAQCTRKSR